MYVSIGLQKEKAVSMIQTRFYDFIKLVFCIGKQPGVLLTIQYIEGRQSSRIPITENKPHIDKVGNTGKYQWNYKTNKKTTYN